jgi:hypothetical protein
MLNLPEYTVRYLTRTKQIPFSRVGQKYIRFDKQKIIEWFREREGMEYLQAEGKN